jgi:hypothetical protein
MDAKLSVDAAVRPHDRMGTHITRVIVGSDRSASHVEGGRLAPSQRVTELFRDANAERRTTTGRRPGCAR